MIGGFFWVNYWRTDTELGWLKDMVRVVMVKDIEKHG